jgi:hypothetical protein
VLSEFKFHKQLTTPMLTKTTIVRDRQGNAVGTMTRNAGVSAMVVDSPSSRPAPGPVTRSNPAPGFDQFSVGLNATTAGTYKIGDGDNLAELAIGASPAYRAPDSTSVAGLTGAALNASFSQSPVLIAAMNIEVTASANTFGTPMKKIYGERNGDFEGKTVQLGTGRSSADYNPKIRIIEFAVGFEPVLSRNRGLTWALPAGETANIIFSVKQYRE